MRAENQPCVIWRVGGRPMDLGRRALIMGVLNVTVDSFSDGGKYSTKAAALAHALRMIGEGADIIDVGGESTRPGSEPVPVEVELERVIPIIGALSATAGTLISVDTSKAEVARAAMRVGAHIINDVTGLRDSAMVEVARETDAAVVIMHMQKSPQDMQEAPHYTDVVREVGDFFRQAMERVVQYGLDPRCVAFDPGIGFGKTVAHNLRLLDGLPSLAVGDRPLLIGVSRKAFIGKILDDPAMERRTSPTVGLTTLLRARGARIFRVHDVRENHDALRVAEAVLNAGGEEA